MSNKKHSSRVQGPWSSSCSKSKKGESSSSWTAAQQNASTNAHHTFQPIEKEKLKESLKVQVLRDDGHHVLSSTNNGLSKVCLESKFLAPSDADWMFETLFNEVQWKQQCNHKFNAKESRLTAWFSKYPYSYSGVFQESNMNWHPLITALLDRLNENYNLKLNSVLANCYRDGHDSVDWHTDSEPALGLNPPIASISFGDTRNFELRKIPELPGEDYTHSRQYRIPLTHGSLLLMLGATQHDWQHRVPREYHDRSVRINLTFRRMFSDLD